MACLISLTDKISTIFGFIRLFVLILPINTYMVRNGTIFVIIQMD